MGTHSDLGERVPCDLATLAYLSRGQQNNGWAQFYRKPRGSIIRFSHTLLLEATRQREGGGGGGGEGGGGGAGFQGSSRICQLVLSSTFFHRVVATTIILISLLVYIMPYLCFHAALTP